MSTLELPPLYYVWRARSSIAVTKESVEARERVLLARIAELQEEADRRTREVEATYHVQSRLNARIRELEADAERYRYLVWTSDTQPICVYEVDTGQVLFGRRANAALDAARGQG